MSKLEAVGSAQEQIAELQDRLADLEEENRQLKMSPDRRAASVGMAEHSGILFRSGFYEWDEVSDRCTICSDGLAALVERPAERMVEALGSSDSLLQLLHPDDRSHYGSLLNQMRLRNSAFDAQYRLLLDGGKTIFVREVREPVQDEYGRLLRSRGFVCDVTETRLAQEKQIRAEQHFQHFAASATHFLWEMGPDHKFSYVSDGIRWITGEDPDEFIGKTRRELANSQTIDAATLEAILEVMERQEPFAGIVIERPRASGGMVHLSISGSPLYGDTGEFLGYRGTAYDVSDSTTTMQALRQSRKRYRELVEGSIQGILVTIDWKPVFANQACAETFGFTNTDAFLALGSVESLFHTEDWSQFRSLRDADIGRDPQPVRHMLRCLKRDGSIIWIESINRVIEWEGKSALQTTVIDLTERKQAEDNLRDSEARLRAIMDHAPAEIFLKDENGRYLEINRHFEQLWDVRREEVRGKVPADIDDDSAYAKKAREHDLAVLREKRMIQQENVVDTAVGRQCLHSTKFPIRNASGEVTGLGAIVINTTDRWAAEEELRHAHDQLEAKVRDRTAELERLNRVLCDSEARLNDAIESISDGFLLFDSDEKVVLCNNQYRKMYSPVSGPVEPGTTLEQMIRAASKSVGDLGKAGSVEDWVIRRLSEYRSNQEVNFEQQLPDGRWTVANVRRTSEGGLVCVRTDITERKRAAMALAESEDRLRQAAELAGIGYCIWDSIADKCLYCSEEYARIHGTTVQGYLATAKPADEDCPFTQPEDQQAYREATRKLRNEGRGFGLEYRLRQADGGTRHVRTIVKPVFDEHGDVIQEYLTIQDITAQKTTEIALRNNQDLLMAIIDHAPAEIDVKDADGKFVLINRQMEALFGAPREEVIGKSPKDFFGPEAVKICNSDDRLVLQTGEDMTGEKTRRSGDGVERTFVSVKFRIPQFAGGGAAVGRIATDISELKQQEKALRDHQEILETIMNSAPMGITVKDPQSRYLYINPSELAAFGVEGQDYIGKTPKDIMSPENAERIMALDRQVIETGEPLTQYVEQFPIDHRMTHRLSAKVPVVVDDKTRFIVTTSLDVTEAKEQERQLRQAQKMEAVGRLTGGIAHDFNNLLAVINGNLLFLRRKGTLEPDLEQYIDAIETAANMGTSLTSELLDFARPRELDLVPVDFPKLVDGMVKSLFRTLPASIEVKTEFPADLWSLKTDPQQLQNALFNIALNARDAMAEGGRLTITAKNCDALPQSGAEDDAAWVEISVTDTGCGMPPDLLDQIFEPFFTTKPTGTGTGLGLSMVHRFVELSGGHIRIASEIDQGTRITILLPRADELETVSHVSGTDQDTRARNDITILIVEDESDVRQIAAEAMRELGYTVLEAADGEQALELIQADATIALVFSDIELGGSLDGYGLANKARALRPDLPVLFCSGNTSSLGPSPGEAESDTPMFRKPYKFEDLEKCISDALETAARTDGVG